MYGFLCILHLSEEGADENAGDDVQCRATASGWAPFRAVQFSCLRQPDCHPHDYFTTLDAYAKLWNPFSAWHYDFDNTAIPTPVAELFTFSVSAPTQLRVQPSQ
jgi:hypothetical protein